MPDCTDCFTCQEDCDFGKMIALEMRVEGIRELEQEFRNVESFYGELEK